jgi:hypothetical protein
VIDLEVAHMPRRHGVEQILVTHVFSQRLSRAQMQEMADAGAVLKIDWYAAYQENQKVDAYVSAIQEIGAEHFLMSSDLGQEEGRTDELA